MSDLIRPDGQLVNGSRSQRHIAYLEDVVRNLSQQVHHLRSHLAVMIYQAGGSVTVTIDSLRDGYDLEAAATEDESAVVWSATKKTPDDLAKES